MNLSMQQERIKMNKHEYMELVLNKLKQYKLNRKQRSLLYEQIMEVVEQMDVSELPPANELIAEISELNNLNLNLNKGGFKKVSPIKLAFGLTLILLGVSQLFAVENTIITTGLFLILELTIFVTLVRNRHYAFSSLALIAAVYTVDSYFEFGIFNQYINIWGVLWSVAFVILGIKILMPKRGGGQVKKFNNQHQYTGQYFQSDRKYGQDNIYIVNNLNSTNTVLTDEKITYVEIENNLGDVNLNLSKFQYVNGDITVNIDNQLGSVSISVAADTRVIDAISKNLASTNVPHSDLEKTNTIYLTGTNNLGDVTVRYE